MIWYEFVKTWFRCSDGSVTEELPGDDQRRISWWSLATVEYHAHRGAVHSASWFNRLFKEKWADFYNDLPFFYKLLFFGWDVVFLKCIFQPSRSLAHHCSLRDLWRTWTLTTCTMEKKAHWMAFLSWLFFHIPPTLWELLIVEAIKLDTVVCNSCLGACANVARWQEALDLVPFSSGRSGREPQQHKSCRIAPTKLRLMTDHKLNKTTATCFSVCS